MLTADRERLRGANHYEVLGVLPAAPAEEIKAAYVAAAKKYHSDAYSGLDLGSGRRIAEELFAKVSEAHQVLSAADRRAEYDAYLSMQKQTRSMEELLRTASVLPTDPAAAEPVIAKTPEPVEPARADAVTKQIQRWRETAERYETEPPTQEGRRELMARAKAAEAARDHALAAYHQFEYASAAFQLAIVLASASVITGVLALAFVGGGLGAIGVALSLLGGFAPHLLHV
jgi:curved DNA-binding protein CbpA